MQIVGMPETFWVVTSPTPDSELGDCCFECDFKTYALQIRGGLEVDSIVGIYSDGEAAKDTATKLLAKKDAEPPVTDTVIHSSPYADWFAGQDGRSVLICDKASDERITVEPPVAWGMDWTWNVTSDGTCIIMRRII